MTPLRRRALVLCLLLGACGGDKGDTAAPAGEDGGTGDGSDAGEGDGDGDGDGDGSADGPVVAPGPDLVGPVGAPFTFDGSASTGVAFVWDFGDGTLAETAVATHTYTAPGNHTAILQVTGADGARQSAAIQVTVHRPLAAAPARWSAPLQLSDDGATLWAVIDDAPALARIDVADQTVDFAAGPVDPRGVALAGDTVAVVGGRSATLQIYDAASLDPVATVADFAGGDRPTALLGGDDYTVSLADSAELVVFETDGSERLRRTLGTDVGALARSPDGELLATRFRSPDEQGLVYREGGGSISLGLDTRADSDTTNRGVPSLMGALLPSPDGAHLYVTAAQCNVLRGLWRDGQPLTFESTARAMLSDITLALGTEDPSRRKLIDDRGQAGAVASAPLGNLLYIAHPGFQTVSVVDAYTRELVGSILDVGHTPRALAVSPDGATLYVLAALDRTVRAYDVSHLDREPPLLWTVSVVDEEPLDATTLQGKRLFHTTRDTRMARAGYVSCALCHPDGTQDGLVWDFTDRGEGLRNTITLAGHGGTAMGRVHWSGNFDEIQDFEGDIRNAQGGSGLLDDADWDESQDPLGPEKAGRSADLDALAAYVASIPGPARAPEAPPAGGAEAFAAAGCAGCHPAPLYTDSALDEPLRHDVGTLTEASGGRLGGPLDGLDTPTLLGVHATAPYLHDGSAPTLGAAIRAHASAADLDDETVDLLALWLRSL